MNSTLNCYNFSTIGLRYFNVFGEKQNFNGDYASVIPKWINQILNKKNITIYGDGLTIRDFIFVKDVVKANLLATIASKKAKNQVYKISLGSGISLKKLFKVLSSLIANSSSVKIKKPIFKKFRKSDIRYSAANIKKNQFFLGYYPTVRLREGLKKTVEYFLNNTPKFKAFNKNFIK